MVDIAALVQARGAVIGEDEFARLVVRVAGPVDLSLFGEAGGAGAAFLFDHFTVIADGTIHHPALDYIDHLGGNRVFMREML